MIGRLLLAFVDLQTVWARPLGKRVQGAVRAIYRPLGPVKDFLNGKWLGHSLHAAVTDVPVGAITLAILFDIIDPRQAADVALAVGVAGMVFAAIAGLADYADTDDRARTVATVHSSAMTLALVLLASSLLLRVLDPAADRTVPFLLGLGGWLILLFGAWVGGEVVYALGNMVNRHAWRFGGTPRWQRLDIAEIPEGVPTRARAGQQGILLFRQGATIHALHDTCAHAGGPLSEGRIVDGCIECPWHGSRYELTTGHKKSGPTTFDQPRYEIRPTDDGGWEVRRMAASTGADT
ncbi:MAG TPA: Rieske (2Fe-2S) protein [Candidatus Limnocylindrales bacterium]|nr:Rieske (2Fe-2S) protein [Candidatus Limnocylindrales bacterium]